MNPLVAAVFAAVALAGSVHSFSCPEDSVIVGDACRCSYIRPTRSNAEDAGANCGRAVEEFGTWNDGSDSAYIAEIIDTIGKGTVWTSGIRDEDVYRFANGEVVAGADGNPLKVKKGKDCVVYSKKGGYQFKACGKSFLSLCEADDNSGNCDVCPDDSVTINGRCFFVNTQSTLAANAGSQCPTAVNGAWNDGSDEESITAAIEARGFGTVWTSGTRDADVYRFANGEVVNTSDGTPLAVKRGKDCVVYSKKGGYQVKACSRSFPSLCEADSPQ